MEDERDWGPRPFRFLNALTLHPKFAGLEDKFWSDFQVEGWAEYRCFMKLKALKHKLKVWNIEEFGMLESKLKATERKPMS